MFSFREKRLICTKLVAVISLAMPFPCDGWFQASSAEGTFEHLVLLNSLWDATLCNGISLTNAVASDLSSAGT